SARIWRDDGHRPRPRPEPLQRRLLSPGGAPAARAGARVPRLPLLTLLHGDRDGPPGLLASGRRPLRGLARAEPPRVEAHGPRRGHGPPQPFVLTHPTLGALLAIDTRVETPSADDLRGAPRSFVI